MGDMKEIKKYVLSQTYYRNTKRRRMRGLLKERYRSSNCMWDFIDSDREDSEPKYNLLTYEWLYDLPEHADALTETLKWMVENTTQYNQKDIDEMLVVLDKVRNVMSENI